MEATHIVNFTAYALACLLMAFAAVALFLPRWPASLLAYGAMWLWQVTGISVFTGSDFWFWGIATLIAVCITYLLPPQIARARIGLAYIAGGSLAGMAVGMITYTMAGIIVGAAIGALLGGIAASRTRAGAVMAFPTMRFFNYVAAKGLPSVVTASIIGAVILQILTL